MGGLIGILILLLVLFVGAIFVIRAIMRVVFRGVAKVGSGVAYHGVRAVAGDEFALKHERAIRGAGSAIGVIGGVVLAGEAADGDFGGAEEAMAGGGMIAGSDAAGAFDLDMSANTTGIDLDGDGVLDGLDTNADGVIDTNVIGQQVGSLEDVQAHTRDDGTTVGSYTRTVADDSQLNNLRPLS